MNRPFILVVVLVPEWWLGFEGDDETEDEPVHGPNARHRWRGGFP